MGRLAVFLAVVLSIWGGMHAYVASRLVGLQVFAPGPARRLLLAMLVILALGYPLARVLSRPLGRAVYPIELLAAVWVGVVFLVFTALLATDVVTAFGFLFRPHVAAIRGAAISIAVVFSGVALVQGLRAPGVADYEVSLRGLPRERDGLVLVQLSDLHLGPILGKRWLEARLAQVERLHPDLVVVTGDLVDHDASKVEPLVPVLRRLGAPLGVFAVTGNHEFYAGIDESVRVLEDSGFRVLRDRSEKVVEGLVLAGVDDPTARRQMGLPDRYFEKALSGRPEGATILLCHSPSGTETAASLGAGLVLSGHTHDGQIWPFGRLVALSYPRMHGEFRVGGATLLVSRGTGTWGPPMRLFRRGEIVRITLRTA